MIEARQISKGFGGTSVLSQVSLQVPNGRIYGLVGYNGVGKTTLLKVLSGIYRPDGGEALADGQPVYENPSVKGNCFFLTEESAFFDQASLRQMGRFYRGYYPGWSDRTFRRLTDWFGLDPDEKVSLFSKGMRRQAGLALAFSAGAGNLFLDEAFDGLDFTLRRQAGRMLRYYAEHRQASLLISSHNLRELEDLADDIGLLSEGRMVYNGALQQMGQAYVTCRFTLDGETDLTPLGAELTERDGDAFLCVLHGSLEEAGARLRALGARQAELRPTRLEEYFRMERKEPDMDWSEIFE